MANTYTKLFQSILDSTIWQEDLGTKVVWITILAMADRDGMVWASVPGLARRAGVDLGVCKEALRKFLGPDEYSRTRENDGRRIEERDGGWVVLNHGKYRNMMSAEERREYMKNKQREYRKRKKDLKEEAIKAGGKEAMREGFEEADKRDGRPLGESGFGPRRFRDSTQAGF